MNLAIQKPLLMLVAGAESLTGIALIVAPAVTIVVLLGIEPGTGALMISRVAGIALLGLGLACWRASADPGSPAHTGVLDAITLYNAGAGALLIAYASSGAARGIVVWIAAIAHLGLAVAFLAARMPLRTR